jgi:hypothetical protein
MNASLLRIPDGRRKGGTASTVVLIAGCCALAFLVGCDRTQSGLHEKSLDVDFLIWNGARDLAISPSLATVACVGVTKTGDFSIYVLGEHGRRQIKIESSPDLGNARIRGVSDDGDAVAWTFGDSKLCIQQGTKRDTVDIDGELELFTFAPVGHRWILATKSGNKHTLSVDGKDLYHYSFLGAARFDATGRHIGVLAMEDTKCEFATDGREQQTWDGGIKPELVSATANDGTTWAFIEGHGKDNMQVVHKGHPGRVYKWVENLSLSNDGAHIAYAAKKPDNKWVVVRDEGEIELPPEQKDSPKAVVLSPDGSKCAYILESSTAHMSVYVDGSLVGQHTAAKLPTFSPDGLRFAYAASDGDNIWNVVVEKEQLDQFEHIESLVFAGNSDVAYVARSGSTAFLVRGREKSKGYDIFFARGDNALLSTDRSVCAFAASKGKDGLVFTQLRWY